MVLIAAALAGCHHTSTARERALEKLPGGATVVAAADGPVLSDPVFRRVIDASRSRFPAAFGCMIDAALAADVVALSGDRTGIAIVLVTHGTIAKCPALSKIAPDIWAATIGAATLAPSRATSVLRDPHWSRARDYLARSPVALAADLGAHHVIGAAAADPLSAWVSIDSARIRELDLALGAFMQRWRSLPLWSKLRTKHAGSQIVISVDDVAAQDVSAVIADVLAAFDASPPMQPLVIGCPPLDDLVTSCESRRGGAPVAALVLTVRSLGRAVHQMAASPVEAVVANGEVVGLRLAADAPVILRRGDVIVAVDSRRVTSRTDLEAIASRLRGHASLSVLRAGAEAVIELRE
ncbi:MAG: hypothetical protein JWO36_5385 [Myxococcales bacterium]|nr:hypothetical protein [Myxococcales bacterium]